MLIISFTCCTDLSLFTQRGVNPRFSLSEKWCCDGRIPSPKNIQNNASRFKKRTAIDAQSQSKGAQRQSAPFEGVDGVALCCPPGLKCCRSANASL